LCKTNIKIVRDNVGVKSYYQKWTGVALYVKPESIGKILSIYYTTFQENFIITIARGYACGVPRNFQKRNSKKSCVVLRGGLVE